jgi:hypothetical protein
MTNAFSSSVSFNGENETWIHFDNQIKAIAKDAISGTSHGIMGALVTPPEYVILNPLGAPYVALVHPGMRPEIEIVNPTTVQQGAHGNRLKTWEFNLTEYLKEVEAISTFKANYLNALDDNSRRLVTDPIYGTMTINIQQIRNILKTEYGTLSPMDVDKLFAKANISYSSDMDMRAFLIMKVQAYAELAAAGEIYGVQAKNRELITSMKSVGTFDDVIEFWQKTNPTVESQVQNSSALSTALIAAHVKNKGLTTAGARNQMNAALTVEVDKRVQAGIIAAATAAAKAAEAICATCRGKVTGKNKKSGQPLKYCDKCFAKYKADRSVP